jgi:hypothetical protein
MRKLAPAAFLISGIIVFGGLFIAAPAQADDEEDSTTSEVLSTPKPHVPHPEKSGLPKPSKEPHAKRDELEQKYGKEGRLSLPPLVIRPKRDTDEVSSSSGFESEDDDDDDSPSSTTTKIDKTGAASAGSKSAGTTSQGTSTGSSTTTTTDAGVGAASAGFIAVNPAAKNSPVTSKAGTLVNPQQNTPIDISNVEFTRKTPADVFIQAAQVGLYAMGAGAIVLSLLAVSRAIRRK